MKFTSAFISLAFVAPGVIHAQVPNDFLHFRLVLPAGYSITQLNRPMMDFDLYDVKLSGVGLIARLYVGNHPDFSADPGKYIRRKISQDITLVEPKAWPGDMLIEFDNLKYKLSSQSPWTRIHVFDITKDPAQRQIITSALHQIQIAKRNLD
jgi:hypothetical protein